MSLLKRRSKLICKSIQGEKTEDQIERVNELMLSIFKPLKFIGRQSFEVVYQKNYEEMCLIMSQKLHNDPKKMTALQYLQAFELLKKQSKPNKK